MNSQLLHKLKIESLFFTEQNVFALADHDKDAEKAVRNNVEASVEDAPDGADKLLVNVTVSVDLENSTNPPYFFKITAFLLLSYGYDSEDQKTEAKQLAHLNGIQICISSIREHLATLTARGPWGPIMMNPVVVQKAASKNEDAKKQPQ